MRDKIKMSLKEVYGDFSTYLENEYKEKIIEILINESWVNKRKWITFNQLIVEIKDSLNDELKVKELQYRLTDIENPTEVCISVLENIKKTTPELERLYLKIKNFS
jgi:hypothetical protein